MGTAARVLPVAGSASAAGTCPACATAAHEPGRRRDASAIAVGGIALIADLSGALYWPQEGLLVVADLHLEKGSAFAEQGVLLPPYDTATTLERLAWVIAYYDPRAVIALGDNFHDRNGPARLSKENRAALTSLQHGRDWVWITGNHDPDPISGIGGEFARSVACGRLAFRHEPDLVEGCGEITGHLHPCARVRVKGRTLTRRCFAGNDRRLVLPAFGAYTGGLNIRHPAFHAAFRARAFTAYLIGDQGIFAMPASRCLEG